MKWMKMLHQVGSGLNWLYASETTFDPLIVDYIKVYKPTGYATYNTSVGSFDYWHDNIVKPLYLNTPYKSTQDWIIDKVVSIDNYNSLSDMNVLQGGGKFYYKGDFNLLWTTYWYNYGSGAQFYATPMNWTNTVDGNISVATANEIPFFRKGNQLYYYQNSTFNIINGISNVQSTILANPNGLQVIYLGTDNNIRECKRTSLTTNIWTTTLRTSTNDVAKNICIGENPHQIYYIGTDNKVWVVYIDGSTWRSTAIDWKVNYAARDLRITNPTTSNKTLCFVGADNKIRRFYWNTCEVLNPDCNNHQYFNQPNSNNNLENPITTNSNIILSLNPATDYVIINLPSDFTSITNIEICNINGQKVKQLKTDIAKNSVTISNLPNGMYVIKIENSMKTTIHKFYKN